MQDSNYTLTKEIYNEIGGDPNEHFDSTYSIALAILKKLRAGGGDCKLQTATFIDNGTYVPDRGFAGFDEVTVAVPVDFKTEDKEVTITENGTTIILKSENVNGMVKVTANVNVQPKLQEATLAVWENHKKYEITPDAEHDGISKAFIDVNVPVPVLEENKTLDITTNGSYTMTPSQDFDAIKQGTIHVNVPLKVMVGASGIKFGHSEFETVPDIFDFSDVTNAQFLFKSCASFTTLPSTLTNKLRNMGFCFSGCYQLKTINMDLDTSQCTDFTSTFENCYDLTETPAWDMSNATGVNSYVMGDGNLVKMPKYNWSKAQPDYSGFIEITPSYSKLEKLTDVGGFTDLKESINLTACPNLSHDSIMNIIREAADMKALAIEGKILKFGETNLARISEAEKAEATNKGWTLQ